MAERDIWLFLDSSSIGGIETHVLGLSEALTERGRANTVVFLQRHGEHPLWPVLDERGLRWRVLDAGLGGLISTLRRERPRLLHTHGYKAGILGRLAGLTARVPVVSTFHAGEPGSGMVRVYNLLDCLSSRLAAGIIAVSEPIAERLPPRTHLIGNFVAPRPLADGPGRDLAFVGRLSHEKGPDLFCELSERLSGVAPAVFGDGPMRAELEPRYPGINFLGQKSDMAPHWPRVGLLCMTSRNEGLPLVALEAMARGIPVAAFAVGALPGLIEHGVNGWLVEPGDLDAMAQVIGDWRAMDAEALADMAAHAVATIQERYSPDALLPRILEVYAAAER